MPKQESAPRYSWCLLLVAWLTNPADVHAQVVQEEDAETVIRPAQVEVSQPPTAKLEEATQLMIAQTTDLRGEHNLGETTPQTELTQAAEYFAQYMAEHDKYGHTADGKRPAERAKDYGYAYCIVLENIAYQYDSAGVTAETLSRRFVDGWKNSPAHRKSMLDPDVSEIGIAVARSEKTGYYNAVQMFGRPRAHSIDFEIANRSGEMVRYKLGEQALELPPRYARSHEMCRPRAVEFAWESDQTETSQPTKTVTPRRGDRIVIEGGGRKIHVEPASGAPTPQR